MQPPFADLLHMTVEVRGEQIRLRQNPWPRRNPVDQAVCAEKGGHRHPRRPAFHERNDHGRVMAPEAVNGVDAVVADKLGDRRTLETDE